MDKAQGIYMWLMYNTIPAVHSNLHKQGHIETTYVLTVSHFFPYKEQPDSETSDITGTKEMSGEDDPSDLHVLAPEEIVRNCIFVNACNV